MRTPIITAAGLLVLGPLAHAQSCTEQWLPGPPVPGADDYIYSATVFTFPGPVPRPPELVIAGNFRVAGDARARGVAAWDGTNWRPIGDLYSASGLGVFDPDGNGPLPPSLVVSGRRTVNGPGRVMMWTGSTWRDVGTVQPDAAVLTQFDPDGPGPLPPRLFAGGYDSAAFHAIAQWDGQNWLPVGAGLGDPYRPWVQAMTVFDPDGPGPLPERLVVAGVFRSAGGNPANGIAEWDGAAWRPLAQGITEAGNLGGYGWALTTFDPDGPGPLPRELMVGGLFETAGGQPARSIASWNGTSWRAIPGLGPYSFVYALTTFDPDGPGALPERLIAYGSQLVANSYANILQWDGTSWSPLGEGVGVSNSNAYSASLAVYSPDGPSAPQRLFAASSFVDAGTGGARNIAAWNGATWGALGPGFEDRITALATFDPDGAGPAARDVIAAGHFRSTPDGPASRIARFDGQHWHALGDGLLPQRPQYDESVLLTRWQPDPAGPEQLVAAGLLDHAGGVPVSNVAIWDGGAWRAAGDPGLEPVTVLGTYEPGSGPLHSAVVAAGFTPATYRLVVKDWDGASTWRQLGQPFVDPGPNGYPMLNALAYYAPGGSVPPSLYVGGYFSRVGQSQISTIARWDGAAWQSVGTGLEGGTCLALTVFDFDGPGPAPPQLVAAGSLGSLGGAASWDGTQWHRMPLSAYGITALTVRDPGSGQTPELFAGADLYDGTRALLRWNGSSFIQSGEGIAGPYIGPSIDTLAAWQPPDGSPPQVCVGGYFTSAGPRTSAFFARWACSPPIPCYANCDASSTPPILNVQDFVCFLNRFAAGDPAANCDGSSAPPALNVWDLLCFLDRFQAGCP